MLPEITEGLVPLAFLVLCSTVSSPGRAPGSHGKGVTTKLFTTVTSGKRNGVDRAWGKEGT